jgi:polyhydroxybutyrate depolymerase
MGKESTEFAARLEKGANSGSLASEMQTISDSAGSSNNAETSAKLINYVFDDLTRRGSMPALVKSYALANFSAFDLNDDGYISTAELDKIINSKLLAAATNPIEKGILRYMQQNSAEIAAAHYEVFAGSKHLSRKDLIAYAEQSALKYHKCNMSAGMLDNFGNESSFKRLNPDKHGLVSEAQLKANLKSPAFSESDRALLTFMLRNRTEIASMNNDQWGWENKISLTDIRKFAEKYSVRTGASLLSRPDDFRVTKTDTTPEPSKSFLPELILDFGKTHFETLDNGGNGFISRAELRKILETHKWARSLGPASTYVLKKMDEKYEQIERSNKDEFGFKDTKGITRKDLEKYAEHQKANLSDIPQTPGDHHLSLTIGGIKRGLTVHIPPGYDGKKKIPVVYCFHYFTGDDKNMARTSDLNEKADKENFIVVYPRAEGWLPDRWRQWNLKNNPSYRVDEMAFVEQLLDKVDQKLSVDKSREYVVGYSNGGMLAHEVATKFSDRLAGVVVVSGCQNGSEHHPDNPLPVMMIHGSEDKLVPIRGRYFTPLFPRMRPLDFSRTFWTQNNRSDNVTVTEPYPRVRQETYTSKTTGADVVILTMQGSGHGWPGGDGSIDGNLCRAFRGSDAAWAFLSRQRRIRKD